MSPIPLFLCILAIAAIYSRYEGFDPRDASSSAEAAKEFANIFGFQKLKDATTSNIVSGKLMYYMPPQSNFFYMFLIFLLFLVGSLRLVSYVGNFDMALMYGSIALLFIIYYSFDSFYPSRNGMYIVV